MEYILNFFNKLEAKDIVTIVISIAALSISLTSYIQKSKESTIALRKQLTDILEKLTDRNLQVDLHYIQKDKGLIYPAYRSHINDQRQFLLREASYIEKKIPKLVMPFEYLLIAGGFQNIGSMEQSEYYFKLALKNAEGHYRGTVARAYARFLFNQERFEEGRARFEEAIMYYSDNNNNTRAARGETYERWADQEIPFGNKVEYFNLLRKSIEEHSKITNLQWRKSNIDRVSEMIEKERKKLPSSSPQPRTWSVSPAGSGHGVVSWAMPKGSAG